MPTQHYSKDINKQGSDPISGRRLDAEQTKAAELGLHLGLPELGFKLRREEA
jgi:hypothetical protein